MKSFLVWCWGSALLLFLWMAFAGHGNGWFIILALLCLNAGMMVQIARRSE